MQLRDQQPRDDCVIVGCTSAFMPDRRPDAACLLRGDYPVAARRHPLLGMVYAEIGKPVAAIAELKRGLASDEDGSMHLNWRGGKAHQ